MPLITGTPDNDSLVGTADADLIQALAGHDYAFGAGGDDVIEGGEGNDILEGGLGDDDLYGGEGDDSLIEGEFGANDRLYGEAGDDRLFYIALSSPAPVDALLDGGTGQDELYYYSNPFDAPNLATLLGGAGSDRISSSGGAEIDIDAGADADFVKIMNYQTAYDIALGSGSDLLAMVSNQFALSPGSPIVVSDFAAGDGGDSLGLLSYLAWLSGGWNFTANPFATGHLQLVQQGADAVIRFDPDGAGDEQALADLIVLQNIAVGALTARNLSGYAANGAATAGAAIDGTAESDALGGTSGDDTVRGFAGNDILYGAAGNDRLEGGEGNDQLDGELGDDLIYGGEGLDNLVDLLAGSDQLFGEGGGDTLFVDRQWFLYEPAATILMDGGEGADQLYFNGRRMVDDVTMIGGCGNDFIRAYLGDNVTIDAGEGNDFVGVDIGAVNAVVTLGAGSDTLEASMYLAPVFSFTVLDFETGDDGDSLYLLPLLPRLLDNWDPATNPFATNHLRLARRGDDTLLLYDVAGSGQDFYLLIRLADVDAAGFNHFNLGYAPAGPIAIAGTDGADLLVGTAGVDEFLGFGGDDIYSVENAGDLITEAIGGGFDQIYAAASYALNAGPEVEVLAAADFVSTAALNLTGNEFSQQIFGNAGANVLAGGGGADSLYGRGGDDVYSVDALDFVYENADQGFDQVYSLAGFTLNAGAEVEVLAAGNSASTAALNLFGNEFGQSVFGNAGANILSGGGGADGLYGLGGDDIYSVDNLDVVIENAGQGFDQVYALASFALNAGAEVEVIAAGNSGSTVALNLIGNEYGQQIIGNAGANTLVGGGGADGLYGRGGDDVYSVDSQDVVVESAGQGFDQVYSITNFSLNAGASIEVIATGDSASTAALNLAGNEFAQQIFGNAGANLLDGGGGSDWLYGLGGADTFAFTAALSAGNVDTIGDFSAADDSIALENAVFTGLPTGALDPNAFRVGAAAADADDRIVYNQATGQLFFDADGNGGGEAVLFATLSGAPVIAASDFTVI